MDLDDYEEDLMSDLWKLTSENIEKAQTSQKKAYDKKSKEVDLHVGE